MESNKNKTPMDINDPTSVGDDKSKLDYSSGVDPAMILTPDDQKQPQQPPPLPKPSKTQLDGGLPLIIEDPTQQSVDPNTYK
jgi:hypothetical protein